MLACWAAGEAGVVGAEEDGLWGFCLFVCLFFLRERRNGDERGWVLYAWVLVAGEGRGVRTMNLRRACSGLGMKAGRARIALAVL